MSCTESPVRADSARSLSYWSGTSRIVIGRQFVLLMPGDIRFVDHGCNQKDARPGKRCYCWCVMTPKKPQRRPDPRPAGKPIPVLLPEPLLQRLDDVAAIMGISRADALRLAARVGLEDLKRVDYDIAQLVVDAVHKRPPVL